MSSNVRIVLSTIATAQEAEQIARALVERRLAACVSIVAQLRSFYWWEGKVHDEGELLLVIKTTVECLPQLREALHAMHSYDLPEFVVLNPEDVSPRYATWVSDAVRSE